jgi:hypothetical protein
MLEAQYAQAEPGCCQGCYSVLWTVIGADGFRPVCHAIVRILNENEISPTTIE